MKWTVKKGKTTREFNHSSYSIKIQKIEPKGSFSVEFFYHDEIRFQRIVKGLKPLLKIVQTCKDLVKRGA